MVPVERIELPTFGLQNPPSLLEFCSTFPLVSVLINGHSAGTFLFLLAWVLLSGGKALAFRGTAASGFPQEERTKLTKRMLTAIGIESIRAKAKRQEIKDLGAPGLYLLI